LREIWARRFPEPVTAFASGWMRVRARARQNGVELPLVISDHADWDGLLMTIAATGAGEIWVTHGQEDALVHWCTARGLKARPLDIVGYGDEDEESPTRAPAEGRSLEAAAGDGAAPAFMVDMDTGQSLRGFRNDGGGEEP
jgi:putative mRNA 3-end processing factor